ncbi:epidermal retinol dehydrogenase 2-like [Daphnia pulex]|uniref:epidermal retinol dehydrogenase 2-like n=1 Tax=Daphnia pulex TaxID=6669 RepID=UPI001EDDB5F1|nr:epidermal retinol dehydrogenase 2-like [Daphnia pulex]XP_046632353.1 epidermal retinol dehydrogenase 2-like [Daphnia pulicaria]
MILQLYSLIIMSLDFCYMVCKAFVMWACIFYRTLFPAELKSISGKIVLITGAGRGIGREVALQFAQLGCTIVCWDINLEAAQETATEVEAIGGKASAFHCDVSQQKDVELKAKLVKNVVPHIDIIINNAGIMPCHPFLSHSIQEIDRCIDINVKGCIWVVREFLPGMIERKQGHLVSMSSIAGAMGCENVVPYSASKFAVRGMMEALTEEMRRDSRNLDIKCTTICPFVVDTGLCQRPRVKFPSFLRVTNVKDAASIIVRAVRRGDTLVFMPEYVYYFWLLIKILPSRVYDYVVDFFDTGLEPHDE